MSSRRIPFVLAVFAAALCLYCGGEAARSMLGDGGVVNLADAATADGTCCVVPAPARTRISSGVVNLNQPSAEFDVSGFHTLAVYAAECGYTLEFRDRAADTAAIDFYVSDRGDGEIPVLGNFVRLVADTCGGAAYVLAGTP